MRVWETRRWTDKLILNPSGRAVKVSEREQRAVLSLNVR